MPKLSPEMQACIEACSTCHTTGLDMLTNHCTEVGGAHVAPDHVRIMLDCIQICATIMDFMVRRSPHHTHICKECAEICRACADSCAELDGMEDCVEACRACASRCDAMAG